MATLIKVDGTREAVRPASGIEFTLEELQGFVGGYIGVYRVADGFMVVNDDGLIFGLPPNPIASALYGRLIVGDVVLCSKREVR